MYDTDFAHLSLGKFSAMVETRLSLHLSKMLPSLKYYYMGFYIHSCPKMVYKGSYQPSYLVDPDLCRALSWYEVLVGVLKQTFAQLGADLAKKVLLQLD
ncbi:Arginyl-tRNA--protein transferase 1 [Massospora cicadina]|nr:Arginyl-tRNA--protein transferase 1 [Massospora cicadina]